MTQRYRMLQGKSTEERIQHLESLPEWVWSKLDDDWNQGFSFLKKYVEAHGNARVHARYKTEDGYPMGTWVSTQRSRKKKGLLSKNHIQKLESLDGWIWDASK